MATTARAGCSPGRPPPASGLLRSQPGHWPDPESLELIPASAIAADDAGTLTCSSRPKSPELNARARSRARPWTASSGSAESSRARSSGPTAAASGAGAPSDGPDRPRPLLAAGPCRGLPPAGAAGPKAGSSDGRRPPANSQAAARTPPAASSRYRPTQTVRRPRPRAGTRRDEPPPVLPPEWRAGGRAPVRRAVESPGAGARPGTARRAVNECSQPRSASALRCRGLRGRATRVSSCGMTVGWTETERSTGAAGALR